MRAAALAAVGGPPPPLLQAWWRTLRWGLPDAGGWRCQRVDLLLMEMCGVVYEAVRKETGEAALVGENATLTTQEVAWIEWLTAQGIMQEVRDYGNDRSAHSRSD